MTAHRSFHLKANLSDMARCGLAACLAVFEREPQDDYSTGDCTKWLGNCPYAAHLGNGAGHVPWLRKDNLDPCGRAWWPPYCAGGAHRRGGSAKYRCGGQAVMDTRLVLGRMRGGIALW